MIEELGPGDAGFEAFQALGARCGERGPEAVRSTARCLLARSGGEPVARASVEVVEGLCRTTGATGILGHFAAVEAAGAVGVLERAREIAAARGAERVIGPMDGDTWHRYRLALRPEPGEEDPSPFLSEPRNPPEYPGYFQAAGFRPGARYESRITEALDPRPKAEALAERVRRAGISVEPLDLTRFEAELRELFRFSEAAFAENLYYRPIDFESFRGLYAALRPLLQPELVRLARSPEGRLVGFAFAFPDLLYQPSGRPERLVLKTLASAPEVRRLGLGAHLTDEIHRTAREQGYRSVIHALMHVENDSDSISQRFSTRPFRSYQLFEWP